MRHPIPQSHPPISSPTSSPPISHPPAPSGTPPPPPSPPGFSLSSLDPSVNHLTFFLPPSPLMCHLVLHYTHSKMDHYFGSPSFPFLHLLRAAGEHPRQRQSSCCWALWMQHFHLIMLWSGPSSSRDNSECSPFSSIPSNSSRQMTLPSHKKSNNNIIRCSRENFLNINLVAHLPTLPSFCPNQYFRGLRALWPLQDSAQSITILPLYQLPFSSGSLLSAQIKRFRAI